MSLDVPLYAPSFAYVWPIVGAVVGGTATLPAAGRMIARLLGSAAAGLISLGVYCLAVFGLDPNLAADVVCATLGGALFGMAVELALALEQRTRFPRHYLATILVVLAILGHWAIPKLVPWLA